MGNHSKNENILIAILSPPFSMLHLSWFTPAQSPRYC